jgi:serine/threonine protein kinase
VRLISKEQQVYERLADCRGHKGILSYHGTFESGIRLQYAPNHSLKSFVKKHDVDSGQPLRWAAQIIEAVDFIHRAGIIHGDLTCANIFLDENLNAKLAGFARSSIDGSLILIAVTASHKYPGPLLSIKGDLIALGSVLYKININQDINVSRPILYLSLPPPFCTVYTLVTRYLKIYN